MVDAHRGIGVRLFVCRQNEQRARLPVRFEVNTSDNIVTYRGFEEGFTVELRPTGHPAAPFVGILRYNEQVYSCNGVDASKCSVASSLPVTEIFRYQGGRWVY